jgi:hypothetical protein
VVYLDFVDFTGYHAPINYGLPRICHVKNADFEHLMNFDRKKYSPKSWGVLPVSSFFGSSSVIQILIFFLLHFCVLC